MGDVGSNVAVFVDPVGWCVGYNYNRLVPVPYQFLNI